MSQTEPVAGGATTAPNPGPSVKADTEYVLLIRTKVAAGPNPDVARPSIAETWERVPGTVTARNPEQAEREYGEKHAKPNEPVVVQAVAANRWSPIRVKARQETTYD